MPHYTGVTTQPLNDEQFLARLLQISKQMSEKRTLTPLLKLIVQELLVLVGAERGAIVIRRDDGGLEVKVSMIQGGEQAYDQLDQISESILAHVFETEESVLVKNASMDSNFQQASSVIKLQLRSVICVPLKTTRQLLGALYVENRSSSDVFSQRELSIITLFSQHAAVAIENAELNQNLEAIIQNQTKQLVEAKETAEQANKAKSDFLAYVSHEVRSPLTSIQALSDLLLSKIQGELNDNQMQSVQQIIDSSDHVLSLVNELLDFHKIESGVMHLQMTRVDIGRLITEQIEPAVRGLLHDKPVTFTVKLAEGLPHIKADTKSIYQILLNVLSNAVKFTQNGTIHMDVSTDDANIVIVVQDTGSGIAENDLEHIFEAYWQSQNNERRMVGSGLGLPITKKLLDLHHGTISIESVWQKGSTFTITLPFTD